MKITLDTTLNRKKFVRCIMILPAITFTIDHPKEILIGWLIFAITISKS